MEKTVFIALQINSSPILKLSRSSLAGANIELVAEECEGPLLNDEHKNTISLRNSC